MKKSTSSYVIVVLALLGGCAQPFDPETCKDDQWFDRGFADGAEGANQHTIEEAARTCAIYHISVDRKTYLDGWKAGRRTLCTPENGFEHGQAGKHWVEGCATDQNGPYMEAWQQGIRDYCKPTTGYQLGQQGEPLVTWCPADLKLPFETAYQKGKNIRLHGSNKDKEKYAVYYQIEELTTQIEAQDAIIAQNLSSHKPQSQGLVKQHRAYRDHLIAQKAELEKKLGLN